MLRHVLSATTALALLAGAPLALADCLLIREPHATAAPAGSPCRILKLRI